MKRPIKKGPPTKTKVKPAEDQKTKARLSMVFVGPPRIDPAGWSELVTDRLMRTMIAGQIERVLSEKNFAKQFKDAPGGREAEVERIRLWLEWHPDSRARIVARSWEDGPLEKAELLSRWLLIWGTDKDRAEIKRIGKSGVGVRESDYRSLRKTGKFPSPEIDGIISEAAFVLAAMVCGFKEAPKERGHKERSLNRRLGEVMAECLTGTSPQAISNAEEAVSKALKKLGFA
ncbi:hypothetical protein [Luteolibacter sp. Populi]|uniref:hypothetical protein n=1 Tax=Luteolibacter sp. Populi TaxID=3230487 RepID=UPI00346726B6